MKKTIISILSVLALVCSMGLVACAHTCTFDKQVATDAYLATPATCQAKATYYYSCECGEKGELTFENGELGDHVYTEEVAEDMYLATPATCTEQATYYKSCFCGAFDAEESETFAYGETLPHTYAEEVVDEEYLATPANCQAKATYYKSCTCGAFDTEESATFENGELGNHVYDKEIMDAQYEATPATCTEAATYYKSCFCGHFDATLSGTFVGATLPHTYEEEVVDEKYLATPASCQSKATYYKSCTCGAYSATESETFESGDKLPHEYDSKNICNHCNKSLIENSREGADANTVFFFDRELGKSQFSYAGANNFKAENVSFDSTKSMTKVDINVISSENANILMPFNLEGYQFNEGDYVIFDIYLEMSEVKDNAEASAQFVNFRFTSGGDSYGTTVFNGGWAQVLAPASALTDGTGMFYIFPNVRFAGSMWLGKATAIPASEVKNIATTGSETAYTFSGMSFVGGEYATASGKLGTSSYEVTYSSIGSLATGAAGWSTNGAVFNQASDVVPYYVNGAIRFYVRSDKYSAPRIVLKLATPVSFSSGTITVTARGVDLEGCKVFLRNSTNTAYAGEKIFAAGTDAGNGYKTYTLTTNFNSSWASESYDYLIIQVKPTAAGIYSQGIISNITLP